MNQRSNATRRTITLALLCVLFGSWATASETTVLERGTASMHPRQPQVAVDRDGSIYAAYGVGDRVRVCRSSDSGRSFSIPVDLPAAGKLSLGKRRGPRVVALDKSICVTTIQGEKGGGRDGDLLTFRSVDAGVTWNGPIKVNDVAHSAREGLHAMTISADGTIHCVWLDLRHSRTEVMSSFSTDGGGTWSNNVLVYASPNGSVCECCHPSVTTHPQRGLIVQWRNSLDGARDMYFSSSIDGGKTFGKASKLGTGTLHLNACPMDGGSIAAMSDGKIASTWRRDQTVYLTIEGAPVERPLAHGEQPWIAGSGDGPYLVWLEQPAGTVSLLAPGSDTVVHLARGASDPVVATSVNGQGPVVAAWERHDASGHVVECHVIRTE